MIYQHFKSFKDYKIIHSEDKNQVALQISVAPFPPLQKPDCMKPSSIYTVKVLLSLKTGRGKKVQCLSNSKAASPRKPSKKEKT